MNLSSLDRIEPTNLRDEIVRRAGAPGPGQQIPEPPRVGRRVAAGVVAVTISMATIGFVVTAFREEAPPAPPWPAREGPWGGYPTGWSELPAPPQWRDFAALVWTGEDLLYLGGQARGIEDAPPEADGYAFDPVTGTWRSLPDAPSAGVGGHAVWTGDEALVFDQTDGTGQEVAPLAFDPEAGTWRALPPSPHAPSWGGTAVWTGTELVVAGGGSPGSSTTTEAYALDPDEGSWRPLPPMPVGVNLAGSAWTGEEVVIVGSVVDNRNHAETRTSIAMAYRPSTDRWTRLPDPPVSSQTADVAWVGGRLIAWELYSPAAAEYLPDEGRWRSLETGPVSGGECYAEGVTVGEVLFSWDCGSPGVFFGETSAFLPVEAPILDDPEASGYDQGVAYEVGDVVLIERIESRIRGNAWEVGSSEAPMHLLVWRPPAQPPSGAWIPTPADAENLVGEFLVDWQTGWEVYLPTTATADVIDRNRTGDGGLIALEGYPVRTWNSYRAREVEPGVFEVRIELLGAGEVLATEIFTVGPGTTADGREGSLVIIDTHPG